MTQSIPSRRRAWLFFLLAILLAGWALQSARIAIPEAWNPWAPLRIDAQPNLLTGLKLARASADPDACQVALAQAAMRLQPLEDRATGPGCGFENAVRIERSSVVIGRPVSLSCRAALSLAMWERHVLQDAARTQLGARVQAIEHFGSYACRNLYGAQDRRRSQHATADAIDIAVFVLDDGRRISVLDGWQPRELGEDMPGDTSDGGTTAAEQRLSSPEARFLQSVRDGACRYFDAVLGPDYNQAHANHFHFDRGRARICR